jgi:hypothetical protein
MKLWLTWCKENQFVIFFTEPKLNHYEGGEFWDDDDEYGSEVNRPKSIRGRVTKPTCWVGEVKTWKVTK